MKTSIRNKKGFTIVELVIVIAVIAILAAVLIPTFASLVEKANQSADIQAVRQMNTQLAIAETDGKPSTLGYAVTALADANIGLDNYTPITAGTQFYWVKSLNRVIYVDLQEDEKIIYPEEYKDITHTPGDWLCLNGNIEFLDYTVTNNTVSVSKAGELAKFIYDYSRGTNTSVTELKLDFDIDLAGADAKFTATNTGHNGGFANTLTIDGNNHTLYGFRDDTRTAFGTGDYANKGYGFGLFGNIGSSGNVTIKNITFDGFEVQPTENNTGTVGLIAGYIYGKLTLNDVTFKNCTAIGGNKIGAVAGHLWKSSSDDSTSAAELIMKNVKFKNTEVKGICEVAKIVGYIHGCNENLTISGNNDFDGIKVSSTVQTISASDFTLANGAILKGASDNTFWTYDYLYNGNTYHYIYGAVTNDWAWYMGSDSSLSATYNGMTHTLLEDSGKCSASTNFSNGKPVED